MNDKSISAESVESGSVGLREFLADMLIRAASLDYPGASKEHPVITVNAIKNLLGDVRDHPPRVLLEAIEKEVFKYPVREDDSSFLDKVASDGLYETVFILDLWEALLSGNMKLAEREAAQIHLVSDRSAAVLECLGEYALQNVTELGSLTYHLLRAYAFQDDAKKSWPLARCLLKEIGKYVISEPHERGTKKPNECLALVLSVPRPELWMDLASAWRLWESDSVRANGFKSKISFWLSSLEEISPPEGIDTEPCMLDDYLDHGGDFLIELALEMVAAPNFSKKVAVLESLRALAKKAAPEEVRLIADRLKLLAGEKTQIWD